MSAANALYELRQGSEEICVNVCKARTLIYGDSHIMPNESIINIIQEQIDHSNQLLLKKHTDLVQRIKQVEFILLVVLLFALLI